MNHQYQPHQNPPVLMPILDAPGLFADAMLTDEGNNLLFLDGIPLYRSSVPACRCRSAKAAWTASGYGWAVKPKPSFSLAIPNAYCLIQAGPRLKCSLGAWCICGFTTAWR